MARTDISATTERDVPDVDDQGTELIAMVGIEKRYQLGRVEQMALSGIDLTVARGEMVAVVGPSGSGKSTLLNVITGIDRPTAGTVSVDGEELTTMTEDELAAWRSRHVGIVFQFFQLLPTLTAVENTILPLEFAHRGRPSDRHDEAMERLALVGLADKADRFPSELSGGEQQRVAIARALVSGPSLLVADEPTGNLDTATARSMLDVLTSVNDLGTTLIFVTHDRELAARARRIVPIRDGRIDDPPT